MERVFYPHSYSGRHITMAKRTPIKSATAPNQPRSQQDARDSGILHRPSAPFSLFKAEAEAEAEAEVEPEAAVAEPESTLEQPHTRRCPSHSHWFAEESAMRPMEEFRVSKTTGKLQGTYCRRCASKQHAAYTRTRRQDSAGPSLKEQVAELQQRLADTQLQLEHAEAEVGRLEALLPEAAPEPA
jgi:hypothetical protein